MNLVIREDIQKFGERANSKAILPLLISKIVVATTPSNTKADFPSGTSVFTSGWDGIVECPEETPYVPLGISLWELGTEDNVTTKANKDYNKRKVGPLGYEPKDCVFIFVTTRFWSKKKEWIDKKKKEGFWKDVKAYDSSDLEQWISRAQGVSRWFAYEIKGISYDGIDIAQEYWRNWSTFEGIKLSPEVVVAGREKESAAIIKFFQESPSIMAVKAASKDEAIAFIIGASMLLPKKDSDIFLSKTLVVYNEAEYKGLSANFNYPLNFIPTFEDRKAMYSAVSNNHHVIVPLGADDDFTQNTIVLPTIDKQGQVKALISSGIEKGKAEKCSRESARNVTLLKKLLKFPSNKTKWITTENVREIIPALLIGRWSENHAGDIESLEKLAGLKYSEYLSVLAKWKNFEDAPIIQIGDTWRLTSPLDAWATLFSYITKNDLDNLSYCFQTAFKTNFPIVSTSPFAAFLTPKYKFSKWSREGITQSLILIAQFGESAQNPFLSNPQHWVDGLIAKLLENATGDLWVSINSELPLLSEASPNSFLKNVKNSLAKDNPEIMDMFKEVEGPLYSTSNHTGLLWALEGLAWLPEYLREVGAILLKLSRLDPGGTLSNRPINSLSEIFKPWHYQTLASLEERIEVLASIATVENHSGWNLLIKMLPNYHSIAHPTHKMRWRIFDKNTNLTYTNKEIWDTHTFTVSLLLKLADNSEEKFAQLIEESVNLSPRDRDVILQWAESNYSTIIQDKYTIVDSLRTILNHHRSYPNTAWALPDTELYRYEQLYKKLQPIDVANKYKWLFDDHWPKFPEGFVDEGGDFDEKHRKQGEIIDTARKEGVLALINELGVERTIELRHKVKESWALGDALAKASLSQEDIYIICNCLKDEGNDAHFIYSFILSKSVYEGFEWIKTLYYKLVDRSFPPKSLANILIPLKQTKLLWEFIDTLDISIQEIYWQKMLPTFYHISDEDKIDGTERLIKFGRYFSAIKVATHFPERLPTKLIFELLEKAVTIQTDESPNIEGYSINRFFKVLDERQDVSRDLLVQLEWLYLPLLDSYGMERSPKILQEELSSNPTFFVDNLKWIYMPKDKSKAAQEKGDISDEVLQTRAKHSYHLLHSWVKIPGLNEDNSINESDLRNWLQSARELAEDVDRLEVADMHIGELLARYPESNPQWPQETIFKVIEEINSDGIKRNYSTSLYNKRGSSSRGPFDGGTIERGHADYFGRLAIQFRNKYPNVSEIFKNLESGYLRDARRMDEEAERDRLDY